MAETDVRFVLCGFATSVRLLFVDDYPAAGGGCHVTRVEEACGADAHIAARIVARAGRPALLLANDVSRDNGGLRVREMARDSGVETLFSARADRVTPSMWVVCDKNEQRTWLVHNPYPEPPFGVLQTLGLSSLDVIYADLYSADWASLRDAVNVMGDNRWLINLAEGPFDNKLSIIRGADAPIYLQASIGRDDGTEAETLRRFANQNPSVQGIFLTRGSLGASYLAAEEEHFVSSSGVEVVHTFGAGAAFSSGVMTGIADGLAGPEICRRAVDAAERYCAGSLPM